MKVVMISSDKSIFESHSEAQKRMIEYGKLFDELHIIVHAAREFQIPNSKFQIGENAFAYSTNYKSKYLYFWNIYKIAKQIIGNWELGIGYSRNGAVISCQDPFELGLAGWLLKLQYKLPLQIQIHTDVFSPYFWQESLINRCRVLLAKFLLPKADGIRVVSERIKNSLIANHQSLVAKISVLPIFVDVQKIQSAKIKTDLHTKYPEYDFIILMASRLTREKNIGLAVEAMKEILSAKRLTLNPLLLIVGDGPEKSNLQLTTHNLQLENNVKFESAVDPGTLFSYYKTSDLFLLTSNYEGYGRTAVEAMAAGVPVVMADVGLAGELLVDDLDGVVIPVGGREELIGAISRLKEDKEYRENLVAESKKAVSSLPEKKEYLSAYAQSFEVLQASFRQKLCYVLPAFQRDDHTHFAYLNGFLEELKKSFDIYLITEKTQKSLLDFLPVRAARMFFLLLHARLCGYKNYYVHYSFLGAFEASLIARMSGGRVFYWNCGEPWKYKRNFIRNLFEYSVYHLISFLVTGTKSLGQQYAAQYRISEKKIKKLPNWIDIEKAKSQKSKVKSEELRAKLHILPQQQVLLFVHRLSKRKGAHHLPEILNRLKDQDVILIIAGDGPEREALNLQLTTYHIQHLVRFLGWIPQNKVLDYFAIADVFLMPSEEEGFPHVLLESMVAGVPFVATNVGGVKDIIPPSALRYVAENGDVAALSEKTKELLHLRGTPLRSLQQDLLEWVRRYDIKKVAEQFAKIISK